MHWICEKAAYARVWFPYQESLCLWGSPSLQDKHTSRPTWPSLWQDGVPSPDQVRPDEVFLGLELDRLPSFTF